MSISYDVSNGLFSFLSYFVYGISSFTGVAAAITCYILWALGIYTVAKRRGIRNPWMAWVPVVRIWLLGCISDQYQYVVHGKVKSKRKILIGLTIAKFILGCAAFAATIGTIISGIGGAMYDSEVFLATLIRGLLGVGGIGILLAIVSVTQAVIRFMALYDLYASSCPQYDVLFLLLNIFFSATTAFTIFFNRNRDEGMPPRREEPVYHRTAEEPWNNQ